MKQQDGQRLYTVQDLAEALGLAYKTTYARIYIMMKYPEPNTTLKAKRRRYYTEAQVKAILDSERSEAQTATK
jgi:hypothetical protein